MTQTVSQSLDPHRWAQLWQFAIETAGSSKAVAAACGVHQSTVTRAGSNPKANLVEGGAAILGWSSSDIYEYCREHNIGDEVGDLSFDELNEMVDHANVAGDYTRMVDLARQMVSLADDDDHMLARAWSRVAAGLDGLGFSEQSEKAARRGLEHCRRSPVADRELRMRLLNNIATSLYHQGFFSDARMYAREVLAGFNDEAPTTFAGRKSLAFVHLLLGHIERACIEGAVDEKADTHAKRASESLQMARALFAELGVERPEYAPMAELAENGLLEVLVEQGEIRVADAVKEVAMRNREIRQLINARRAGEEGPIGIQLESRAWASLIMAGVAIRYMPAGKANQCVPKLLKAATEIGRELDSWSILRRVADLKFGRQADGQILDENDRSLVIGLISRFGNYRDFGFKLLQQGRHVTACAERRAS